MTIGIFGGSFNPIHIGHAILASYISESTLVDEVWFMVSPKNPLKSKEYAATFEERLEMCKTVVSQDAKLKVCGIESEMQPPYYTINTLRELKKRYPDNNFKLIIGTDNLQIFHKWKDYQSIIDEFGIIVYPRRGYNHEINENIENPSNITLIDAPIIEISSTYIRNGIANGKDMQFYVPEKVNEYLKQHKLYING